MVQLHGVNSDGRGTAFKFMNNTISGKSMLKTVKKIFAVFLSFYEDVARFSSLWYKLASLFLLI
jgi:hypothetical protein